MQCDLLDPDASHTVASAGWKLPEKFVYHLNPNNLPPAIKYNDWLQIAENSIKAFDEKVKKTTIEKGSFTNISRKGFDGKNIIAWGSVSSSALGVTYVWYYPKTGYAAEIDTILNRKFIWTWSGGSTECAYANSYDAQNILTHEIGHWFGLNDHYTNEYKDATMYGYGAKTEVKKNTLTDGDLNGLKNIYN